MNLFNPDRWLAVARRVSYNAARLARELKISPRQLHRYTHKFFGSSPQHWLHRQRLVDAGQYLKEHRSVKIAAYHLGFKQPCHFSREFKRHYGLTPKEFLVLNDPQSDETAQTRILT